MTEPLNPYAVTTSGQPPSYPIHFGGQLTRDDLWISLRDSPPKRGFARFQYPLIVLVITSGVLASQILLAASDALLSSITLMMLAFLLLPGWLSLIRIIAPGYRKRLRRLEVMSANQRPTSGWLDEEYFVIGSADSTLRARWSFFTAPFVFPSHLMLPLVTDPSHRVILPVRFFSSAEDVRHVCQFLSEKLGLLVNLPADEKRLAEGVGQADPPVRIDVEQARRWSDENWPFESDIEQQFDWTVDLTANETSRWFAFKVAMVILLFMLWYVLPVWVATAAWLLNNYLFFGDWNFLIEQIGSTAIVLGPAGFIFCFFMYSAIRSAIQTRHIQSQPLAIRMRTSGIHLSQPAFDSWFAWTAVKSVITEEKSAGWVAVESLDEVRFPPGCFDSQESFESFKAALRTRSPGIR